MQRRCFRVVHCAMISMLFCSAFWSREMLAADARPNVIIVLSDDQGYGDFSGHGNPVLKTPNLDRLAQESVRLTDFHVAPMCTPTRGQLLTGLDACRTGATSVCAGRSFIKRGTPTMAEIFAQNNYKTALFGKWHLGDSYPNLPHFRGFDETVYHLGWGITSMADTWQNDLFDGRFFHNGKLQQYPGFCTDVWFDLAIDWIKERKERGEPFFLYLPTNAPHTPHWVPEKYEQAYRGAGRPAAFFGMIANIDENMGRLEKALADTGLKDNTILIYFNDNGGTAGVNLFNAGMRGRKTTYYEGGHRAACFLRGPRGTFGPPRDLDVLAQVQDLLPTLIELCGLRVPPSMRFDGENLFPRDSGPADSLVDRKLVVQYGQPPRKWESAVLWKKWRLVHGSELYDIASDPGQQHDVAAAQPKVLQELRKHYETWWADVEPGLSEFSPVSIGSQHENPVTLSAADWTDVYVDNMGHLRSGKSDNSFWQVLVETDGRYEISLRRWPKEAAAPIAAGVPAFNARRGTLPPGRALPIAKVRLKVGNFLDETKPVPADAQEVTFSVDLKGATGLRMQTWCYDAAGNELCGAYFAEVKRE